MVLSVAEAHQQKGMYDTFLSFILMRCLTPLHALSLTVIAFTAVFLTVTTVIYPDAKLIAITTCPFF